MFYAFFNKILQLSRLNKILILLFLDTLIFLFSHFLSYYLRLDVFFIFQKNHLIIIFITLILFLNLFFIFNIYKSFNRYINLEIIKNILYSCSLYLLIFFSLLLIFEPPNYPRSLGLIQPIIFFLIVVASRISISKLYFNNLNNPKNLNIAIYGAGEAGYKSINLLSKYNIRYFIDDDVEKHNLRINNIPIISKNHFKKIYISKNIKLVFIALPSISIIKKRLIISEYQKLNISIKILPSIDQIISNKLSIEDYEDINMNIFLNRKLLKYEDFESNYFLEKNILITGGGGSIGSEIFRQLLSSNFKSIIILDHSEFNLFNIKVEITDYINSLKLKLNIKYILGSICDEDLIENIFSSNNINVVFHAAAYKHLNIVEENIFSSIRNNLIGTYNLAKKAKEFNTERFILVSTDKAVRPSNIMGASKRMAEIFIHLISKNSKTIFSVVRFGNVLGSSGSVVQIFKRQIYQKKQITLTHKDVERYFMTISEAVSLVIQSSTYQEQGKTYILNMGQPIKIYDLALKMIKNANLTIKDKDNENGDVEILITGLNQGEKISEELFLGNGINISHNENILIDNYNIELSETDEEYISKIKSALRSNNKDIMLAYIKQYVEDFK